jgi:UDP-N-acetylglucosamine:LPS N-acetylglucosamine transferase
MIDIKKQKEAEWIRQHTLTKEQIKQLILDKFKRAEAMQSALKQREMPNHRHR